MLNFNTIKRNVVATVKVATPIAEKAFVHGAAATCAVTAGVIGVACDTASAILTNSQRVYDTYKACVEQATTTAKHGIRLIDVATGKEFICGNFTVEEFVAKIRTVDTVEAAWMEGTDVVCVKDRLSFMLVRLQVAHY